MWLFLSKLKISLPYDTDIPLPSIYPNGFISCHRNTCTSMFIDNLVIITRKWNQPKCLSPDEYIMKMWYIVKNMKFSS